MNAELFLDTNLFIYQLDAGDERKAATADTLIRTGVETGNACISFQVVQECLNTILHKAAIPLGVSDARAYLDHVLVPLLRVSASAHLYHRGLDIQDRYRIEYYDALIVAAALEAGCTRLLTEDLQDGQRIETLTIENPFVSA